MAVRPNRPHDPVREHLVEVRRGLMRLHKTLIDSERAVYESRSGPLNNVQLLQLLLEDPFFEWLRPFSRLMAEMDGAAHGDEPVTRDQARAFVAQASTLVTDASGIGIGANPRYGEVRRRDTGVQFAHSELQNRVGAALAHLNSPE